MNRRDVPIFARKANGIRGIPVKGAMVWPLSRQPARLVAAAGLALLLATPAGAQLLPDTGTTMEVGGLRQQLEGLLATGTGGTPTTPGWSFVPSIAAEERWTNAAQTHSGQYGDAFITVIRPGALVNADTSRVKATLNYFPDLQFGTDGFRERIDQNLNSTGQITVLPEHFFINLRGYAAVETGSGGYGPNGTVSLDPGGQTQSTSFSASPYLRQHFSDFGSAELGASVSDTAFETQKKNTSSLAFRNQSSTFNQRSTSEQEYLSFTTGPEFSRYKGVAQASAQQSQGTGIMNGSIRQNAWLDNGFAVTRDLTLLAKFGYEVLRYSGTPPYRHNGALWNGGIHWVPNPDSSIELRYGERDGRNSALFNASYAPTDRIRLFAHYSEALSTDLENLQSAVNSSVLDPLGNPVDEQTGAPLLLANNFYGVQNNLTWTKSGSLTATLLLERDSVSVSVSHQDREQVAAATTAATATSTGTTSNIGTYGSVNWQHDLSEALTGITFVQYGVNDSHTNGSGHNTNSLTASAGLNYAFSESLSGSLRYSYSNYSKYTGYNGLIPGGTSAPPVTHLVMIRLLKTF